MKKTYDVAVVGLGVMGSAITHYLAKSGLRVLGLERFWPNHERGSSSGSTRLIRKAHFELPAYVPLSLRSYELWADVARESGRELLLNTGGLVVGSESGKMVQGTLRAAREHGLDFRLLSNAELRRERPSLRVRSSDVGVLEKDTSLLLAENCVTAHLELAVRAGAELRFGAQVGGLDEIDPDRDAAIDFDVNGVTMSADRVVVAAGPWTPQLLPLGVIPPLEVERIATYWFDPVLSRGTFEHGNFPAVLWDHPREPFLIVPDVNGSGVKVAFHHSGHFTRADDLRRLVTEGEIETMRSHLRAAVPELNGRLVATRVGMYTNTRDGHFAIGEVQTPRLILTAACSGHGFKFAPVIGEIVTEMIVDGATRHSIDAFRLDRPSLYKVSQMAGPLADVDDESSAETG